MQKRSGDLRTSGMSVSVASRSATVAQTFIRSSGFLSWMASRSSFLTERITLSLSISPRGAGHSASMRFQSSRLSRPTTYQTAAQPFLNVTSILPSSVEPAGVFGAAFSAGTIM